MSVVGWAHSRLRSGLTMEFYLAERHIEVTPYARYHLVENRLRELGHERRIGLRVPHFSVLPDIIAGSELLVTVPSRLGRSYAAPGRMQVFGLPFRVPEIEVTLHWHEGGGDLAARRWLCAMLRETLGEL